MDSGHKVSKNPSNNADLGFQAVGPALRIMQLNVEGCHQQNVASYSHWQRSITLKSFAFRRHTSITTSPTASQSQVSTSSATHSMPNMDVRHMFTATSLSLMLRVCRRLRAVMSFMWADITLPTFTNHQLNTGTTQICHQSFLSPQSWLETLTAIIRTGDIRRLI